MRVRGASRGSVRAWLLTTTTRSRSRAGRFDLSDLGPPLPGMAEIMPLVGERIWKCYYAGKAHNRKLAAFQLKEAVNLMQKGSILRPKYEEDIDDVHRRGGRIAAGEHRGRGLGRLRSDVHARWSTRPTPTTRSTTRASCAGSCPRRRRPTSTSPPRLNARSSGLPVLRARAALGGREAPALGGDGAALHAVRRRDLDLDETVVARGPAV